LKSLLYGGLKRRQIILNRIPDSFNFNIVVLVPQPISDTANLSPSNTGAQNLGVILQPNSGLADDEHFALDGSLGFFVAIAFSELV
jgi:hypothetical protein